MDLVHVGKTQSQCDPWTLPLGSPQILSTFDSCFSQFIRTLRFLGLRRMSYEEVRRLMEFVCRFQHLGDLVFTQSFACRWPTLHQGRNATTSTVITVWRSPGSWPNDH